MTPKENLLKTICHNSPQWIPNGMESVVMVSSPIVERPNEASLDAFDVRWSFEAGAEGGTFPAPDGNPISDLSQWREQITIPDLDSVDWSPVIESVEELNRDDHLISGFVEMGLFERSYLLLGMEEALIAYVTERQAMYELVGVIADYKIDLIRRFDDAADLDILWYGDDWGTQSDLFMPPVVWREIIKPHTLRIYDCLRERNILINQHSCGKIDSIFGDIVEMGADIWNPCQPCNDLVELKKRYGGSIAFCGGIDSQYVLDRPGVTPDEVRAEVRTRICDLADGGGYIAAPSHSVPYVQELLDAMNDEIASFGGEFYKPSSR